MIRNGWFMQSNALERSIRGALNSLPQKIVSSNGSHAKNLRFTAGSKFFRAADVRQELTVEKMHVFVVFTEKYLRSYGCSGINFTATVNCTNPKTETQSEIIETQITEIKIYSVIKKTHFSFLVVNLFVCS